MSINNAEVIISHANKYISNINRLLKSVKSNVSANFIHSNNKEVVTCNLNIVEKYIKKLNSIDTNNIISL